MSPAKWASPCCWISDQNAAPRGKASGRAPRKRRPASPRPHLPVTLTQGPFLRLCTWAARAWRASDLGLSVFAGAMGRRTCGVARSRAPPPGGAPRRSRGPGPKSPGFASFHHPPAPSCSCQHLLTACNSPPPDSWGRGPRGAPWGTCGGGVSGGASGAGPRGGARALRAPLPVPPLPPILSWAPQGRGTSPSATTPFPLRLGVSPCPTLSHLGSPVGPTWADRQESALPPGAGGCPLVARLGWSGPAPALPSPPCFLVCETRGSEPPPVRGSHRWRPGTWASPGMGLLLCPQAGIPRVVRRSPELSFSELRGNRQSPEGVRGRALPPDAVRGVSRMPALGQERNRWERRGLGCSMLRPQLARLGERET